MRRLGLTLFALLAACSFSPGGDAIDGGPLPIDAPDDGVPLPIDGPTACVAACTNENTTVTTCDGNNPIITACANGCAATPAPHCRAFSPSNGAGIADVGAPVTASLNVPAGRVFLFHTDSGLIEDLDGSNPAAPPVTVRPAGVGVQAGISFRQPDQAGTVGLAIWGVDTVTVLGGQDLARHGVARFVGPRAAVVVARGPITINGAVDSGAGRSLTNAGCRECGGAGGGNGGTTTAVATGCAPGGPGTFVAGSTNHETGGAGGGMSTQGSSGGDSNNPGGSSTAITTCPDADLEPLAGGSGGGRGGFDGGSGGGALGGGGGGAVQLSSLVSLTVTGIADLYAGGAGGAGHDADYGGGGGGAGGALLLEAPLVSVTGTPMLTANGGAGGSGRTSSSGEGGNRSLGRASGGAGSGIGMNDGRGGLGGISTDSTMASGLSTEGSGGVDGTGGGGASAGRIRINAVGGAVTLAAGAVVSPAATIGTRPIE